MVVCPERRSCPGDPRLADPDLLAVVGRYAQAHRAHHALDHRRAGDLRRQRHHGRGGQDADCPRTAADPDPARRRGSRPVARLWRQAERADAGRYRSPHRRRRRRRATDAGPGLPDVDRGRSRRRGPRCREGRGAGHRHGRRAPEPHGPQGPVAGRGRRRDPQRRVALRRRPRLPSRPHARTAEGGPVSRRRGDRVAAGRDGAARFGAPCPVRRHPRADRAPGTGRPRAERAASRLRRDRQALEGREGPDRRRLPAGRLRALPRSRRVQRDDA